MTQKAKTSHLSTLRSSLSKIRKLKALVRKGDYQGALPLAEGLAEEFPEIAGLHSIHATCRLETGDEKGAREVIMNARRKFPEEPEILIEAGSILYGEGNIDESERELRKYLTLASPEDRQARSHALLLLGYIMEERGERVKAEEHWEAALREDPDNADAAQALEGLETNPEANHIQQLIEKGRFGEAESTARSAAGRYPDEPGFPLLRAVALWKMEKHRKAAKVLTQALARFPEEWTMRITLGHVLNEIDDFAGAESAYRAVLEHPDVPAVERGEILSALAGVLWGMHHREDALDHWKKALQCDPRNEEAKEALAECTNEYGEPKSPTRDFDDMYHFINIHKERYFRLVGREEFETKNETELVLGLIMNGWNTHVTPFSRELDSMKTEAKSKLFRRVTLDFSPVVRKWGKG